MPPLTATFSGWADLPLGAAKWKSQKLAKEGVGSLTQPCASEACSTRTQSLVYIQEQLRTVGDGLEKN
jgi:hypothetical protein